MKNPCKTCNLRRELPRGKKQTQYVCGYFIRNCEEKQAYEEHLKNKRKYEKGTFRIETLEDLFSVKFVWLYGRPVSNSWVASMQAKNVREIIQRGLYEAVLKESDKDDESKDKVL